MATVKELEALLGTDKAAGYVPTRQYHSQGKLYFLTNGERTKFLCRGTGNSEHDVDVAVADFAETTMFGNLASARAFLKINKDYERSDFGSGQEGLRLFKFWASAQIQVMLFKTRDLRIATHLEKGD